MSRRNIKRPGSILIIGSGIHGLAAGALLAEIGCEVHVLEAHKNLIGGHARSFEVDNFRFCAGPQYVWNFSGNRIGMRALKFLNLYKEIPFDPMDPSGFEWIFDGDADPQMVPMGLSRFQKKLVTKFPKDRRGLEQLFSMIGDLHHVSEVIKDGKSHQKSGPEMMSAVALSGSLSIRTKVQALRSVPCTLSKLLDRLNISNGPRSALYGHSGIFAESISEVSAPLYAAATGHYHRDAAYPRYGFHNLIDGLCAKIEIQGGSVECGKKVVKLKTSGGRVIRAHCENGESYSAETFISNLAPGPTRALLGDRPTESRNAPSNTMTSCYIGVHDYPAMTDMLNGRNLWWYADGVDVNYSNPDTTAPPQMLYIASPTANGNANSNKIPKDQSLCIFAPADFDQARRAAKNGAAHTELRERSTEWIVDVLDQKLFPGIREKIKVTKTLTPWDLHLELGCERGNIYGRRMTPSAVIEKVDRVKGYTNLHVACAAVGWAGIASGFQTASLLVRKLTGVEV